MAWYWYIAVFVGVAILSLLFINWFENNPMPGDEGVLKGLSHLIIISLLSVIVVFLFVELK